MVVVTIAMSYNNLDTFICRLIAVIAFRDRKILIQQLVHVYFHIELCVLQGCHPPEMR